MNDVELTDADIDKQMAYVTWRDSRNPLAVLEEIMAGFEARRLTLAKYLTNAVDEKRIAFCTREIRELDGAIVSIRSEVDRERGANK